MSLTYSLPISDWYFDTTSEWTLDYPPLFAIFELFLAFFAHLLKIEEALVLTKSPIRSDSVIIYQKITVILSDLVYLFGVYKLCNSLDPLLCGSPKYEKKGGKLKCNDSHNALSTKSALKHHEDTQHQKEGEAHQAGAKFPSPAHASISIQKPAQQSLADAIYRPDATSCIAIFLLFQPGLLLVDHIHFQYNGFLSGVLLISMADVVNRRYMAASFWFAVLLNLKHIYLYCAPAYGMYLLVSHCIAKSDKHHRILTFLFRAGRLGSIVISVFAITFTPFADQANLKQIVGRLFPFKRGLTHAYWAPNVWSLYNMADKILATVFKDSVKVNFDLESISRIKRVTSTSGLVQEYEHSYLPTIKPMTTFILVGLFTLPIVIKFLFRINKGSPRLFLKALTIAAFTSFMFGWHVHEKAILLVILPITPLCFTDPHLRSTFLRLTLSGIYSLFPLIHQPAEYPIKICLLASYYLYTASASNLVGSSKSAGKKQQQAAASEFRRYKFVTYARNLARKLYALLDKAYVVTLILNELYIILLFGRLNQSWNPLARLSKFEFLPLMLTSTLTAAGITSCYLELLYDFALCADELAVAS